MPGIDLEYEIMDVPGYTEIEYIDDTHAKSAYVAAANNNIPHTTGVESNITVVNNVLA